MPEHTLTYSIEEAGKLLGIGRDASYEAARTGRLPVIRIGRKRMVVPKAAFHKMLESPPAFVAMEAVREAKKDGRELWAPFKASVEEYGFNRHATSYLAFNEIRTIGDLVVLTERYLLSLPGIGAVCVKNIKERLAQSGLHLGMNADQLFV